MPSEAQLEAFSDLVVRIGANVQEGQDVVVHGWVEHRDAMRAVVDASYRAGARYVEMIYRDDYGRRALATYGADEDLSWSPPHSLARLRDWAERRVGYIQFLGDGDPNLFDGLDPARVGKAEPYETTRLLRRLGNEAHWSRTIVPCATAGWARQVYGEPDVERLWGDIFHSLRLDEADAVAAWREHIATLQARARALNDRRFDAIRFHGGGTDLTVGLLRESRWIAAQDTTNWGLAHCSNMPTEEVFTTPDRRRTEGVVRATKPFNWYGYTVGGLEVEFREGRAVRVDADDGGGFIRSQMAADEGGAFLGEVALVDASTRIPDRIFYNGLFDENVSCHVAYGNAYVAAVEDADGLSPDELRERGINVSATHVDFMIGAPEIAVDGVTTDGGRVPVMRENRWVLEAG